MTLSIRRNINWIAISQLIQFLMQILSLVILSRLLPTTEFGLMAMAGSVSAFAMLFKDFGTGSAIIQKSEVSDELLNSVFWLNLLLGLLIFTMMLFCAAYLGDFFKEPRLKLIIIVIAPSFLISALSIVHQSMFERLSDFKTIAFIDMCARVLAILVAVVIAYKFRSVFSLVAMSLVHVSVITFLSWQFNKWRPNWRINLSSIKSIANYSMNLFTFNFLNYIHRNSDTILIGKFLGALNLGYYDLAYKLMMLPVQSISFLVNKASLPEYSKHQNNRDLIQKHYVNVLQNIALISGFLSLQLWAMRLEFIEIFLGENWLPSAEIIAWLAPIAFFQALLATSGSVLSALGRTDILKNLGLIGVPLLTLAIVIGLTWGIKGVAITYAIASVLWVYPVMRTVMHQLSSDFSFFIRAIIKPLLISGLTAILTHQIVMMIKPVVGLYFTFAAGVCISSIVYFVLCYYWVGLSIRQVFDK